MPVLTGVALLVSTIFDISLYVPKYVNPPNKGPSPYEVYTEFSIPLEYLWEFISIVVAIPLAVVPLCVVLLYTPAILFVV